MRFIPAVSLVRIQLSLPDGPLVKWLRLRPFTAASRVRISYGSPKTLFLKERVFFSCIKENHRLCPWFKKGRSRWVENKELLHVRFANRKKTWRRPFKIKVINSLAQSLPLRVYQAELQVSYRICTKISQIRNLWKNRSRYGTNTTVWTQRDRDHTSLSMSGSYTHVDKHTVKV